MTRKKRWWLLGVLLAAFLGWLLTGGAFMAAESAYSRISLRFPEPLHGDVVENWLSQVEENENRVPLTFWREEAGRFVKTDTRGGSTSLLSVHGDSAAPLPHPLIAGSHPAANDWDGCSISEALAFQLWGSTDVIGQRLTMDKDTYTIRGIFSGDSNMMTVSGRLDKESTFSALMLPFSGLDANWEAAEWLRKNPLPGQYTVIDQPLFAGVVKAAYFLPIWLLAVMLFCWTVRFAPLDKIPLLPIWAARILVGIGILVGTALLCGWDFMLPQRLIPTKWSDFAFWEQLFSGFRAEYRKFLALPPLLVDIWFRENATGLLFTIALVCPAMCVPAGVLAFRDAEED